jgi:hypothetical protein
MTRLTPQIDDGSVSCKIQHAYLGLLKLPPQIRLEMQPELCLLRDAIAIDTGMKAEDVQNEFEFQAFKASGEPSAHTTGRKG